jgi:ribonucleoside-diphosphate reductase alpha chain
VQHLDCLSQDEKDVYKTAFELDQRWIVELAADRTPDICQSQSVNLFIPGDVDKWDLHMLHWQAWERGMKSLYYLRSKSVQRASHAGAETVDTYNLKSAKRPTTTSAWPVSELNTLLPLREKVAREAGRMRGRTGNGGGPLR